MPIGSGGSMRLNLRSLGQPLTKNGYGQYLLQVLQEKVL